MVEAPADMSGARARDRDVERESLNGLGLHFCARYRNLVRFDPVFCGRCPFNGLKAASGTPRRPGTRF